MCELGVSMRRAVGNAHGVGRSCRGRRCRLWRPGADIECALMELFVVVCELEIFGQGGAMEGWSQAPLVIGERPIRAMCSWWRAW